MRVLFLLVFATAVSAQSSVVLEAVNPDYGDDAKQPMLTLPFVIEFGVEPNGTPFSLASLDGGLEDRVVQALSRYRFVPSKTPMNYMMTVPLKQPISSYEVGETSAHPPSSAAVELAAKIDPANLAKMERDLPKRGSETKREALLVHAATHSGPDINDMRVRQLDWLIQNEPASEVLKSSVATISKVEDPAGYAALRQLWLARVRQNPVDKQLVSGASNFLRLADPEEVLGFLRPYSGRMLHAMEWIGELYGLHAIGATAIDPLTGIVIDAAPRLQEAGFPAAARAALLKELELPVLLSAFAAMNSAARTLNSGGRLPEGFESFCGAVLKKIKGVKPNFQQTCEERAPGLFQVPPNVMAGKIEKQQRPVYPDFAKRNGIQGTVILGGVIGTDGRMAKLTLIKGPLALYQASRDAVLKWVYKPYLVDGQPVEVITEIEVNYALR